MITDNITNPELTANNDLSKTQDSMQAVMEMTHSLQAGSNDMLAHFHEDFRWIANTGCGEKQGIDQFRANWQLPLRAAFTERTYYEVARIAQGEWVSAFGYIEAKHTGVFMGIQPTNKTIQIHYTDFWKVKDGKIADNWVTVDFPRVLAQLGKDVFDGKGWESFDNGTLQPPVPD